MGDLDEKKAFCDYVFRRWGVTINPDDDQFNRFFKVWKNDIIEAALSEAARKGLVLPNAGGPDPNLIT